jgi:hypothetical protein
MVSQSDVLTLRPPGTYDQIVTVVKTVAVLPWVSLPDGKAGLSCNKSQSLSVLVIYVCLYFTRFLRVVFSLVFFGIIILGPQSTFCTAGCAEVQILLKDVTTVCSSDRSFA